MHLYQYDGPVFVFEHLVQQRWKAETMAPTEAKARNNLAYRWKKENGKSANAKVNLPDKITLIE